MTVTKLPITPPRFNRLALVPQSSSFFLAMVFARRGLAYASKGDYDRAIADYDEAIKLNPEYAVQQKAVGFKVWSEPLVPLRVPLIEDLRADPFERAVDEAEGYGNYILNHAFLAVPAQAFVGQRLQTYIAYPPRQKPGSFSLDQVLQKLQEAGNSGKH